MTYEEWGEIVRRSPVVRDWEPMYADWTADRENSLEGYHACCREGALLADRCDKLTERVRRLETALDWLTHIACGCGRGGGSPEPGEVEAAVNVARAALDPKEEEQDICGLCGKPGADKMAHPVHWPGEQIPDGPMVHTECEEEECKRAHAVLSDKQRREFLRSI